jgi:hypothetical protein
MNPALWAALSHIESLVRLHQQDMTPGLFASLMDTLTGMRDAALDTDGHLRYDEGSCDVDCPACKEV